MTAADPAPVLHHINLKTTRLEAMIEWYGRVVGTTTVFKFPAGAWLTNDGANHRIALLALPGLSDDPDKERRAGLHHTAFEYATFADLMGSFERLHGEGITPEVCLDHGMTISLYFRDPDRNMVELQADAFGSWEASKAWMQTSPAFAANPIGVMFDPEQVLAAFRAGAPFQDLHRRIMSGEFLPQNPPDIGVPPPHR
jgi:catechol-2,3-dioxygenase